ncbi:hypothetical protein RJ55_02208 [Drechmeria coniospora]|nr:hypothetical protein RJ55_02208 [Drechmeria coniospora]
MDLLVPLLKQPERGDVVEVNVNLDRIFGRNDVPVSQISSIRIVQHPVHDKFLIKSISMEMRHQETGLTFRHQTQAYSNLPPITLDGGRRNSGHLTLTRRPEKAKDTDEQYHKIEYDMVNQFASKHGLQCEASTLAEFSFGISTEPRWQKQHRIDALQLHIQIYDGMDAGTWSNIFLYFGPKKVADQNDPMELLFKAPSRGDVVDIAVNITKLFGSSEISLDQLSNPRIVQAPIEDWFAIGSVIMDIHLKDSPFVLRNAKFANTEKWLQGAKDFATAFRVPLMLADFHVTLKKQPDTDNPQGRLPSAPKWNRLGWTWV